MTLTENLNRAGLWRALYWSFALLALGAPTLAYAIDPGFGWSGRDFVFAIVLVTLTGGVLEVALRTRASFAHRLGAAMALGAGFLLIWVNGAIGIIGNEDNPANLLFMGVLAVAMAGTLVAALKPAGMARAMQVTAGAQFAVFAIAWASGQGFIPFATLFWCALWLGAGALSARAAREEAPSRA